VQCHPRLHKLLLASDLVTQVYDESGENVQADYYEWLMSCPGKLHLQAGDVPTTKPWLEPPPDGDDSWKEALGDDQGFKVGLNFQGNPDFPHDQFRSLDVRNFTPLFEREDVRMVSIQKGFGEDQLDKLPKNALTAVGHLLDTGDDAFVDTARCIHGLDLLITSDTAVAHLAGAMGCRC
jgi:ADP-heptose:LPS heptosyltransferase